MFPPVLPLPYLTNTCRKFSPISEIRKLRLREVVNLRPLNRGAWNGSFWDTQVLSFHIFLKRHPSNLSLSLALPSPTLVPWRLSWRYFCNNPALERWLCLGIPSSWWNSLIPLLARAEFIAKTVGGITSSSVQPAGPPSLTMQLSDKVW